VKKSPLGPIWKKIGIHPHHGIDLQLSSLRTEKSCGIGEFLDLLPLIDWCHQLHLDVIQLLPINDSGNDPSPYNALSSCALHPIFLSLRDLPFLENAPSLDLFHEYNQSEHVAYNIVLKHKQHWLHSYFTSCKKELTSLPDYAHFISTNPWLKPYALFKTFKELECDFAIEFWPEKFKRPSPTAFEHLCHEYAEEIAFHSAIQYLCFKQLSLVKQKAKAKKIHLMGDIPILISRESADVWHHPHLFDLERSAGAPPDMYSEEGQYWGFPLFDWEVMKKEDYHWWKERLSYAANFYDLYRLDHVVGFFKIWGIPIGEPSKNGSFIPEDESLWIPQGKERLLALISTSSMLPIAEDLGAVPAEVRLCLHNLGICTTKVVRWERRWDEDESYIPPMEYPPISLTCVSTHDSEPLSVWWEEYPEEAALFAEMEGWTYISPLDNSTRKALLHMAHQSSSLFHINLLQEYLAFFPDLSWPDSKTERINIPGTQLPTNWTYRLRPTIEQITTHTGLARTIRDILSL
jgi:4-alpha-glucanotransferase